MPDYDEQNDMVVPALGKDPASTPDGPVLDARSQAPTGNNSVKPADESVNVALVGAEPVADRQDDAISAEVKRQFELVPEIGLRWRWYDWPYRLIDLAVFGKRTRQFWPRRVRRGANRLLSIFSAFNRLERERVSHLNDPLYTLHVPDKESIRLPAFWLVEYYSPSHAGELQARLTKGKWRRDISRPGDFPHKSLRRGRDSRRPGGWERLATFVPMDSESASFEGTRAVLPPEFSSISLQLVPMGSSLSAVVAKFELSREGQLLLDVALRDDHVPNLYWHKGTLQVRERMFVGIRHVNSARERLHDKGRAWMTRELPGAFADRSRPQHPALDLILTRVYDPVSPERNRNFSNYIRALGLDNSPFSRTFLPEFEGFRLDDYWAERDGRDRGDQGWQLVSKTEDGSSEGTGGMSITGRLGHVAPGLLTRLGLFALLEEKQTQAARARDAAHRLHKKRPVDSAKMLRRSVLTNSLDLTSIAGDIEAISDSPTRYGQLLPNIETRDTRPGREDDPPDRDVAKEWAKRQREWARDLRRQDENLIHILGLSSSLSASIDSIRSQRWSLAVALLSLITSGLAAYLAYAAIVLAQSTL